MCVWHFHCLPLDVSNRNISGCAAQASLVPMAAGALYLGSGDAMAPPRQRSPVGRNAYR